MTTINKKRPGLAHFFKKRLDIRTHDGGLQRRLWQVFLADRKKELRQNFDAKKYRLIRVMSSHLNI